MSSFLLFAIQRVLETLGRLTLPNLSSSVGVARLRYIQSIYESSEHKNPDTLVRNFLPRPVRWLSLLQAKMQLSKLRSSPFYYYLIARTMYYDQVFVDAVGNNIKNIINIGCGTDTRSHRFVELLKREKVSVIECDQSSSITVKQQLAKEMWCTRHVTYLSIDLNAGAWPDLLDRLGEIPSTALVMLEGVSSYVNDHSFSQFLDFLADNLKAGSQLAYDYKIAVDDAPNVNQVKGLFRLPSTREKVAAYHKALGYELSHMELSSDLSFRLLPDLLRSNAPLFTEDCLLQLTVTQRAK